MGQSTKCVRGILILFLITLNLAGLRVSAATREIVDRIVAVVDTQVITLLELEAKSSKELAELHPLAVKDPQAYAKQRQHILEARLEHEISEKLIAKEIAANRDKLAVSDKDIDKAIEEVLKLNKLTYEQLQAAVYAQGLSFSEYRHKLQEQIERARLLQFKVQGKVQLKDSEVTQRCLDEHQHHQRVAKAQTPVPTWCISHILWQVKTDPLHGKDLGDLGKQRAKAQQIRAELLAKGSTAAAFAEYARKYSADHSAPDGELGCFTAAEMLEPIERALRGLKVGEISALVETELGIHILRLDAQKALSTSAGTELDCSSPEVLAELKNEIYQEKLDNEMQLWLADLRKKTFVEIKLFN